MKTEINIHQQHFLFGTVGHFAREQVKKAEERVLAAVGQRNVLGADLPAEHLAQHFGQHPDKCGVAARSVVVADHGFKRGGLGEDRLHPLTEHCLNLWDMRWVAAAEHEHIAPGHRRAQIVHQLRDA